MADQQKPTVRMHPALALLSGLAAFGLLGFLILAAAVLISEGVPAEDRGQLIGLIVLASVGLVGAILGGAMAAGSQNLFGPVSSALSALWGIVRR